MWEEGEASLERPPYHDDASAAKTGRSGVLVGPFFSLSFPSSHIGHSRMPHAKKC